MLKKNTLKTLNNQLDQEVLKSPVDGTIHLNEDLKGQTELPKGTIIAEIYPKQTEKNYHSQPSYQQKK